MDRLKRITDLFVEGTALELGRDSVGAPVVVWVNKLNSFEDDECRKDGLAARSEKLMELDEHHPDVMNARSQLAKWDRDQLVEQAAQQKYDEDYLAALDDIESEEGWKEKLTYLRRMDELHTDADVPVDDPRREKYAEINEAFFNRVREIAEGLQADRRKELLNLSVEELTENFVDDVKNRIAMSSFMEERRISEIWFATRDCQALPTDNGLDHSGCDHRKRMLENRADVRTLPEAVIVRIVEVLTEMTVDRRAAGNSDAPANSSESSEQPNPVEESTVSTQEVTEPVVLQT
jgi:hypothetical protein